MYDCQEPTRPQASDAPSSRRDRFRSARFPSRGVPVLGLVGVLFWSAQSRAYCLKTSCEVTPTPANCFGSFDPNGCSNEGMPLHWRNHCLSVSVQRNGSSRSQLGPETLAQAVSGAFGTWASVVCDDGRHPNLRVESYPEVACDAVGYKTEGPNQNLWVFRDEPWTHETGAGSAIALTILSINPATGEIFDADVELNSYNYEFTTSDASVATDLASIVLHEAGHTLGIGHSPWATSTMADAYHQATLEPRTLEQDDINAICAAIPPGHMPDNCDPEPLGGFSTECEVERTGCTLVRAPRPPVIAIGLLLLIVAMRRCRNLSQTSNCRVPRDGPRRW